MKNRDAIIGICSASKTEIGVKRAAVAKKNISASKLKSKKDIKALRALLGEERA